MEIDNIAKYIDHTLLKPEATKNDIHKLCAEAIEHGFASVCVNPYWVSLCAALLQGSDVKVCTVVGFPLGAGIAECKAQEAVEAIKNGAGEIDMVINIGALKSQQEKIVLNEIKAVRQAIGPRTVLKVIIETCKLNDQEKKLACELAQRAGANYIKTSTGFGESGATIEDVQLMRVAVQGKLGVKAAGGIKNREQAEAMIKAGATRIGSSSGIKITTSNGS